MKIVHITTSLGNGGLENMLVDIANCQVTLGHSVAIIIVNSSIEESILQRINDEIKVFRINRERGRKSINQLIKLMLVFIKLRRYDIIHCHGIYLGKLLRFFSAKPRILTLHALNLEIEPLKYYNSLVAISNAVKTDIEKRSNFSPSLIYNGINFDNIKFKNQEHNCNRKCFRLVQVGRLNSEIKGQDILIRALNHLVKANDFSEFELDFIGSGQSYNDLMNLVKKLDLEQKVTFLGNKSRAWIHNNLFNYDLFIQPSRFEGFGLTVVEAMAAKIPVIVADNDGPSEIINKGEYGYIFENGDFEGLSNKILHVIKNIKMGLQRSQTERAYLYGVKKFNIITTTKEYMLEYRRVLC